MRAIHLNPFYIVIGNISRCACMNMRVLRGGRMGEGAKNEIRRELTSQNGRLLNIYCLFADFLFINIRSRYLNREITSMVKTCGHKSK